jgi:hypothetical protein
MFRGVLLPVIATASSPLKCSKGKTLDNLRALLTCWPALQRSFINPLQGELLRGNNVKEGESAHRASGAREWQRGTGTYCGAVREAAAGRRLSCFLSTGGEGATYLLTTTPQASP